MHPYFRTLTGICREVLRDNLVGLYAQGSVALDDFRSKLSDFDVMAVVKKPPEREVALELFHAVDHRTTPVPSHGLELVLVTQKTARELRPVPRFENWLLTGYEWRSELLDADTRSELLIFFTILLQSGRTLYGRSPVQVFSKPPKEWVLQAMEDVLEFHLPRLLDPFHDPKGRNSVLNAARSLHFAETGRICSKTQGGEIFLRREKIAVVEDALAGRTVDKEQARAFVERVLAELRSYQQRAAG